MGADRLWCTPTGYTNSCELQRISAAQLGQSASFERANTQVSEAVEPLADKCAAGARGTRSCPSTMPGRPANPNRYELAAFVGRSAAS
jgi:hypothetical protein